MSATEQTASSSSGPVRRGVTPVESLATLVGWHPDAFRNSYRAGRPADPADLGVAPRGRVLSIVPLSSAFLVVRPILRALASDHFPWQGKVFDHGGNSGQNRVLGREVLRFHASVGPSEIDGAPTLVLGYKEPAFKNPWPVSAMVDELRSTGDGIAVGPAFLEVRGTKHLLLWWGLEAAR